MLSLDRVVDGRPLAVARIVIGLTAGLNAAQAGAVLQRVADGRLALPVAGGLPTVTPLAVQVILATVLLAAAAVVVGIYTRPAALVLVAVIWVLLAWEQQTYSSHLLLSSWLLLWLAFARSDARWSLRARRHGPMSVRLGDQLPMMTQLSVCYAFAAISKLNWQFLSGAELRGFAEVGVPSWLFAPMAVLAVATEIGLAVLLWLPRTQLAAMTAGVGLHVSIPLVMSTNWLSLVSFSATCLCLYPLFWAVRPDRASRSGRHERPRARDAGTHPAQVSA